MPPSTDEHKNEPNTASTKTATLADGTVMTKKLFNKLEKQAQKPGNKTTQIYAACALAECHDNGIFVDKDAKKAFR